MGFAPAVCYNKGRREHMKGGVDQERGGKSRSRERKPPFLLLLSSLSESVFFVVLRRLFSSFGTFQNIFPRWILWSFPAFSLPGCNMSANCFCEGVVKPLNSVSIILSLWQIFKKSFTLRLGTSVSLSVYSLLAVNHLWLVFTKCEWMMHFSQSCSELPRRAQR